MTKANILRYVYLLKVFNERKLTFREIVDLDSLEIEFERYENGVLSKTYYAIHSKLLPYISKEGLIDFKDIWTISRVERWQFGYESMSIIFRMILNKMAKEGRARKIYNNRYEILKIN